MVHLFAGEVFYQGRSRDKRSLSAFLRKLPRQEALDSEKPGGCRFFCSALKG